MTAVAPGGRVLVTGASGFVGATLTGALERDGFRVVGTGLSETSPLRDYRPLDLRREPWRDTDVDGVVHLAGLAAVGPSFDDPQAYLETNSALVTHLLEPLLAVGSTARIVIVSSGAVYGGESEHVLTEASPVDYASPYVVSKVLVESQAAYYRRRGLDVVVARPFNHIGPGQRPGFIVPDLAAKLRDLPEGGTLTAGNLDAARDYTDVRDVAAAYRRLLTASELSSAVYNVASGASRTGWDVLRELATALGRSVPEVATSQTRAVDPSNVVASADRLIAETGWRREYDFAASIRDFVAAL